MRTFTGVVFGVVALLLAGCSDSSDDVEQAVARAIEKETGEKTSVNIQDDGVEIRGDRFHFSSSGKGVELPADFPDDILRYPGAMPSTVMKQPSEDKKNSALFVGFSTTDSIEKVHAAYTGYMLANGWKEKTSFKTPDASVVEFEKGERSVMCSVGRGGKDGETFIHLVIEPEE